MPRGSVILVVLATLLVWVPAASADRGNGLYEPFPEPAARDVAQAYVEQLGISVPGAALQRGSFLALPRAGEPGLRLRAGVAGAATRRAGVPVAQRDGPAAWWLAALLVPAALAVAGLGRRRGAAAA